MYNYSGYHNSISELSNEGIADAVLLHCAFRAIKTTFIGPKMVQHVSFTATFRRGTLLCLLGCFLANFLALGKEDGSRSFAVMNARTAPIRPLGESLLEVSASTTWGGTYVSVPMDRSYTVKFQSAPTSFTISLGDCLVATVNTGDKADITYTVKGKESQKERLNFNLIYNILVERLADEYRLRFKAFGSGECKSQVLKISAKGGSSCKMQDIIVKPTAGESETFKRLEISRAMKTKHNLLVPNNINSAWRQSVLSAPTVRQHHAGLAVDGKWNVKGNTSNCFKTKKQGNPWLVVRYFEGVHVNTVRIRKGSCSDDYSGLEVRLFTSIYRAFDKKTNRFHGVPCFQKKASPDSEFIEFSCLYKGVPIATQYVSVQQVGTDIELSFSEIEVLTC